MLEIMKKIYQLGNQDPHRLALVFDEERLTYGELIQKINEVSNQCSVIKANERVGLLNENPIDNIIYYFAIHHASGIPCFFNSQWNESTVKRLIKKYQIHWVIKDKSINKFEQNEMNHVNGDHLLHIGFTSGTTGLPKAYYRNESSWIISYEENEKLIKHQSKVIVAPGPLSHSLSLYACIYALFTGRTFIGQKKFNIKKLVNTIHMIHQPTSLFVVPTMLYQFVLLDIHVSEIKSIFSSGAKLSKEQFEQIVQLYPNTDLIEFFGTSEASFISYNFNQTSPAQSVGKIFSNVEVQLSEQDSNQIGLLNIRSDMTFSGYVGEEQHKDTWIETGDYAFINHNHLFLVGRKGDRLIVGGVNVYPNEIEQRVMTLNGVEEAIVIGVPHHKFGEIVVLLYTGSQTLNYLDLKKYLIKHLSRYEIPSKIKRIDAMVYTESGKIAREKMKSKYVDGEI